MDPKIKAEWIKALRSGEYEQGEGVLCNEDSKFCCLGVLVDIAHDGFWTRNPHSFTWQIDGMLSRLDEELCEMVGIPFRRQDDLIDMNDTYERSFLEIADWIEENL